MKTVRVIATIRDGILDPQGAVIATTLKGMGFGSIESVRQGIVLDIEVDSDDPKQAIETMLDLLPFSRIMYDYEIIV